MMEKEYELAKDAYEKYNLNTEYLLTEKIMKYIETRIKENKEAIEKILKIYNRSNTYEEIVNVLKEDKIKYKKQLNINKREDGFVHTTYLTSIGVVAIEVYNVVEVVKYLIAAIKTRNSIIISDIEYEEKDDKHLILLIVKEALKKFGVDENLVEILPYEECNYNLCDKVIFTYVKKKNIEKVRTNKLYIYLEDKNFQEIAKKEYESLIKLGKNVEILTGNFEEVIYKINETVNKGALIYTTDSTKAYKFINFVKSYNVFVNATLENCKEVKEANEELLMNKNIMYELKKLV